MRSVARCRRVLAVAQPRLLTRTAPVFLSSPSKFSGSFAVRRFCSGSDKDFQPQRATGSTYEELEKKLQDLVTNNKVVLFMKGSPEAPQCGFSATTARILEAEKVADFTYVNVLSNSDVREGVKKFSDWPTIPQLYIGGEFVGGADIVGKMHQAGELSDMLKKAEVPLDE